MTSTSSDRFYKLLGDLSPDLLAGAFPEAGAAHNATSFRARHAKRIGRMILLYAACAVLLVGAIIYLPQLVHRLSYGPMSPYYTYDGEWKVSKLEEIESPRDLVECIDGTTDTPFICLNENRTLHLELTCRHQGTDVAPFSHSFRAVHLEVLIDGSWYRLPEPKEQGLCQIEEGATDLSTIHQTLTLRYCLSRESYGDLPEGHYRAAVEFMAEHSFIYAQKEAYDGAVYIPFTVTEAPHNTPLTVNGKLNTNALVVASSSVPACCYAGTSDTSLICLSESRQLRTSISLRYPYCEFEVEEHYLQAYSEPELQYYQNGIWYALPYGNAGASPESTLIRATIDNSTLIPESLAKQLPTGKYRAVYRVHVIHKQSLDKMNPDEDYVGAIYVDFHVVDDRQNPILYANGSGGRYTSSWYDFEAHSRGERSLGKVYRGKFDPYDPSNPDARYAVELYYIDSDYTARPMNDYLLGRGFRPVETTGSQSPSPPFTLTENEISSITPEAVQEFYGLDVPPAITVEHKSKLWENSRQQTLHRVDLIWGEKYPGLLNPVYNRINFINIKDTVAGGNYPYAVSATICIRNQTVSAKDFFASVGWEVLPDGWHIPQMRKTGETVLLAATYNQLQSVDLNSVAAFYGCKAEDVSVSFVIAVHADRSD